jgi:DNA-directed RNA polymerase subunit RPC12/RpoP
MTEPTRRPILSLKNPPRVAAPPAPARRWKCKPCGAALEVPASLADEDAVRCPSCNARLGRAGQFRSEDPEQQKVRARLAT